MTSSRRAACAADPRHVKQGFEHRRPHRPASVPTGVAPQRINARATLLTSRESTRRLLIERQASGASAVRELRLRPKALAA
jgi:hypothetical protein